MQAVFNSRTFVSYINQISVLDLACGHGGDIFKYKRLSNIANPLVYIAKEELTAGYQQDIDYILPFSVRFGKVNLGTDFISG